VQAYIGSSYSLLGLVRKKDPGQRLHRLLVQGSGQTCVEEFQQVQIACTPFESGVLQMAWWF